MPLTTGRRRQSDVICGQVSCLKGTARDMNSVEDCFNLFFDDAMFNLVVDKTNILIIEHLNNLREYKQHIFESSKYSWLEETYPKLELSLV